MFIVHQTINEIRRHPVRTIIVSLLIAVLMVAAGGIYAMSVDVRHTIGEMESNHSISVYLKPSLDQAAIQLLLDQTQRNVAVLRAEYISPADGLKKLAEQYPQFASVFKDLTRNPIPPLLRVYPASVAETGSLAAELRALAGVQSVEYDQSSVQGMVRANEFVHSLLAYVMTLAGLLFVAGFCLMAFSVINGKRKETAVLSLVGASNTQVLLSTPAHLFAVWAIASLLFIAALPRVVRFATSRLAESIPWVTPVSTSVTVAASALVVLLASLTCLFLACVIATILAYRIEEEQRREESLLE
ncbi:MAG: permease-like cell division protein FtsX [Caldisericota bacterium]|nr:permease-like cell division protein FtsX [Caldisericota bacterium]